jgi:enoyl-CoA hydratase/carnithine racemase
LRERTDLLVSINRCEVLNALRGDTFQELKQELFARCFETEDKAEGVAAFLGKRKPVFKGR